MGLFGGKKQKDIVLGAYHIAGLPVSDGVYCAIMWDGEKVTFMEDNNRYYLDIGKIVDIVIKTETEIQQAYVSSAGGAVAGAALFGPLGAVVGGRVKEKQVTNNTNYFVFSYKKSPDQETEFISFRLASAQKLMLSQKLIDAYRAVSECKAPKEPKEIEL